MVEDRVDNLLSKNTVEIKVDRSPLGEDSGLQRKIGKSIAFNSR